MEEILDLASQLRESEEVEEFRSLMDSIQVVMAIRAFKKAWLLQWRDHSSQITQLILDINNAKLAALLDKWQAAFEDPDVSLKAIIDDIGESYPEGNQIYLPNQLF